MNVDIIVIGAGIAGCTSAMTACRSGARVALVGPSPELTDKPGDSLSPAARSVLLKLELEHLLQDPRHRPNMSSYASWGSSLLAQKHAIQNAEGEGYIIHRAVFERELETSACQLAKLVRNTAFLHSFHRDTKGNWNICLKDGEKFTSKFLIDASGRNAVVARHLSAIQRADRLTGVCAFLSGTDQEASPMAATLLEAVANGWWYATLLPDNRLSLAFFSDSDLLPRQTGKKTTPFAELIRESIYVRDWLAWSDYRLVTPPRIHNAATQWLESSAGAGWAAAGDAAVSFDPLSSHGMTSALWTGQRVAEIAVEFINDTECNYEKYNTGIAAGVSDFLHHKKQIYSRERRWRDQPFWQRRQN